MRSQEVVQGAAHASLFSRVPVRRFRHGDEEVGFLADLDGPAHVQVEVAAEEQVGLRVQLSQ